MIRTDTLIETIGDNVATKVFDNNALSIAVVEGDYIEFEVSLSDMGQLIRLTVEFYSWVIYIE